MEEKGETENQTPENPPPPHTSLYVGDLDPAVTEEDLQYVFGYFGTLTSVSICRRGRPLCHGYVSFASEERAMDAMRAMNHAVLRKSSIRVMLARKDLERSRLDSANLFVKNLDQSVDGRTLEKIFAAYGTVVSCKVVMENGRSKGYGYVQFSKEEEADAAISQLCGSVIAGNQKLHVAKFMKKSERLLKQSQESKFSNLYVKNFSSDFTDDALRDMFSAFGPVQSAVVMKDEAGNSKGFGFVSFSSSEDAKKAMRSMNGLMIGSDYLYVGVALTKDEREQLLQIQSREPPKTSTVTGSQTCTCGNKNFRHRKPRAVTGLHSHTNSRVKNIFRNRRETAVVDQSHEEEGTGLISEKQKESTS